MIVYNYAKIVLDWVSKQEKQRQRMGVYISARKAFVSRLNNDCKGWRERP